MKIPKEYILVIIAGFFLLSYLMDAVVDPLPTTFPTPYHYFNSATMSKYAFATTAIFIRAAAFLMTPIWLASFFKLHPGAKGGLYLVLGSLMQLYAVQPRPFYFGDLIRCTRVRGVHRRKRDDPLA